MDKVISVEERIKRAEEIYNRRNGGYSNTSSIKKEKKKSNSTLKGITGIIDILGVIVYLLVSFITGAWYITWIIFLAVALVNAIIKLIFGLNDDSCDCEKCACKEDGEDDE